MTIEDPRTGREVFYYRSSAVAYGTKLRCGNAWYVSPDERVGWWQDLERLKVVK